jgi:hypothetical protein
MIVPYETRELPVAGDFDKARQLFQDMDEAGLPAFAMHFAGLTFEESLSGLVDTLPAAGFVLGAACPTVLTLDSSGRDLPLHLNTFPGIQPENHTDIAHAHGTTEGSLRASFLVPTKEFVQAGGDLPPDAHQLFLRGQVDNCILEPICHTATVKAGGWVAFRLSGRRPLAQHFRTLEYPRVSHVFSAHYTPGGSN